MSRKNMRPGTLDWHRRMRSSARRQVPADPYGIRLAVLGRIAATMKGKPYEDLPGGMSYLSGDGRRRCHILDRPVLGSGGRLIYGKIVRQLDGGRSEVLLIDHKCAVAIYGRLMEAIGRRTALFLKF